MSGSASHRELLELAFDLSPAGMVVVDGKGAILLVNREIERLFGYDRLELLGRPIETLIPSRFRPPHAGYREHYAQDPARRPMGAGRDLHGLRKDGTEVPVEIGLNPIQTEQGLLVLGTVVDISARRAFENRLRQSQKMEAIGTLAGGIAHDFNNLLHGILGHAELIQRRTSGDDERRADVQQILKIADRGRLLVDRILAFSRAREATRAPVRLDQPVHEALELLRASLPREIEIRESLSTATPMVSCDETQIHQITMNLCTNSAQAMERGGTLEVTLAPFEASAEFATAHPPLEAGPHARLSVRDTGVGMAREVIERALEPFFTTKPAGKGTGLGLSVIHGIVQSLGGALEITSRVGDGTRVDIYLRAEEQARAAATSAGLEPGEHRPHVLVVEDEPDLASMLRRQLEAFEYRATVHTSSVEALDDFLSRPDAFDLLMTDNSMPRMSGIQLAGEIRRIRPELPILLVSGTAALADPAQLQALGIVHVLGKPHTGRQMSDALQKALGREP